MFRKVSPGVVMKDIEMYKPKYDVVEVFKALKNVKSDELLPESGPLEFFYRHIQYPGISLFLRDKNRVKFFYLDDDSFIMEIKDQVPEWGISVDKNLVRITLEYKVEESSGYVNFVFDISDKSYRDLLEVVRKKKEIKLYYLTMVYGGLVFDSYKKLIVPSNIVNALKAIG